jgi:hypothetical protein
MLDLDSGVHRHDAHRFSLLLTGAALALGPLVIVAGVAVAALTLATARGFAVVARARVDAGTGRRMPRPAYRPGRPGVLGAVLSAGADPRRWLDLVHGLVASRSPRRPSAWWSPGGPPPSAA